MRQSEFGAYLTILLLSSLSTSGEEDDYRSYLSKFDHYRFLSISPTQFNRQTYVWSQCSSDEDCIPIEYQNVSIPTSLISCNTSSGLCKCQKCFIRSKDVCKINRNACNKFMADTSECSDDRKFQKTTLLLSVFLSATGAANFYIGQNILGGVQLGLLLLLILLVCALVYVPCCLFTCLDDEIFEEIADHICFVVFIIFAIFAIMMLIAVIAGWWITDLVIFIIGGRGDGNGCALYADL